VADDKHGKISASGNGIAVTSEQAKVLKSVYDNNNNKKKEGKVAANKEKKCGFYSQRRRAPITMSKVTATTEDDPE